MKNLNEIISESTQVGNKYNIENLKEDEMAILVGWLKFMHNDITKGKKKDWERLKSFIDLQDGWNSKEFTEEAFMRLYDKAMW
jgi:hypothetical protein